MSKKKAIIQNLTAIAIGQEWGHQEAVLMIDSLGEGGRRTPAQWTFGMYEGELPGWEDLEAAEGQYGPESEEAQVVRDQIDLYELLLDRAAKAAYDAGIASWLEEIAAVNVDK